MRHLLLVVPVVALLACGGDDDDEGAGTVATVTETSGESSAPSTAPATEPSLVPATEQPVRETTAPPSLAPPPSGPASPDETAAIADLASQQGVDPSQITTVSVENVTWRNSAVGCPEPGLLYQQVLTDGVRIVLEVDGTRYQYHSGGGRPVFYCATPEPPVGE